MSSYLDNVTVNRYNGHITGTNPIVRHVISLTCTLKWMHANQNATKHATTQSLKLQGSRRMHPDRDSSVEYAY